MKIRKSKHKQLNDLLRTKRSESHEPKQGKKISRAKAKHSTNKRNNYES